jgi:hypothetical protein
MTANGDGGQSDRRTYLKPLGALGAAGVAGCTGDGNGDDGAATPTGAWSYDGNIVLGFVVIIAVAMSMDRRKIDIVK